MFNVPPSRQDAKMIAIERNAVVSGDGNLVLPCPELKAGQPVKVIVLAEAAEAPKPSPPSAPIYDVNEDPAMEPPSKDVNEVPAMVPPTKHDQASHNTGAALRPVRFSRFVAATVAKYRNEIIIYGGLFLLAASSWICFLIWLQGPAAVVNFTPLIWFLLLVTFSCLLGKHENTTRSYRKPPDQMLLNRFTLKRKLGRGGYGEVWLAKDAVLGIDVAVKFIEQDRLCDEDEMAVKLMLEETKRHQNLAHPNIVRVYQFFHEDEFSFITMEYVDGDTLQNLKAQQPGGVFETDQIQKWISQLCEALEYLHATAGVVHYDLKPNNLMVNKAGDLKVMDFGVSACLSAMEEQIT